MERPSSQVQRRQGPMYRVVYGRYEVVVCVECGSDRVAEAPPARVHWAAVELRCDSCGHRMHVFRHGSADASFFGAA